jgi:hypothetical protein
VEIGAAKMTAEAPDVLEKNPGGGSISGRVAAVQAGAAAVEEIGLAAESAEEVSRGEKPASVALDSMKVEEPVAGMGSFHDTVMKPALPGAFETLDPARAGNVRWKGAFFIRRLHLTATAH